MPMFVVLSRAGSPKEMSWNTERHSLVKDGEVAAFGVKSGRSGVCGAHQTTR